MFTLVRSPMPVGLFKAKYSESRMSKSTNSPQLMFSVVLALKPSLVLVAGGPDMARRESAKAGEPAPVERTGSAENMPVDESLSITP